MWQSRVEIEVLLDTNITGDICQFLSRLYVVYLALGIELMSYSVAEANLEHYSKICTWNNVQFLPMTATHRIKNDSTVE